MLSCQMETAKYETSSYLNLFKLFQFAWEPQVSQFVIIRQYGGEFLSSDSVGDCDLRLVKYVLTDVSILYFWLSTKSRLTNDKKIPRYLVKISRNSKRLSVTAQAAMLRLWDNKSTSSFSGYMNR